MKVNLDILGIKLSYVSIIERLMLYISPLKLLYCLFNVADDSATMKAEFCCRKSYAQISI